MSRHEVIKAEIVDNTIVDFKEKARSFLQDMGFKLRPADANKFIELCGVYNLNPFTREIYPVVYQNTLNIIVGYEVYIKRAERSGLLKGWKTWTEGSMKNGDLKACIEIIRAGFESPFYHEVYFSEYALQTPIWKSKPITMIKKVAIAQGFRLAFPCELGGIPYTSDELNTENAKAFTSVESVPKAEAKKVGKEESFAHFINNLNEPPRKQEKILNEQEIEDINNMLQVLNSYDDDADRVPF